MFKHALVQDTAYETLLRARRRKLHQTAARTIADEFPALAEAQPEVIARHWSEAGDAEQGFPEITRWTQTNLGRARAQLGQVEAGVKLIRLCERRPGCKSQCIIRGWQKRKRWMAREM